MRILVVLISFMFLSCKTNFKVVERKDIVLDSVSTDFLNGVFSTLTPIVTTNTQATKVIDSLGEDGKNKAIVSPRSKFLNNFGKKGE